MELYYIIAITDHDRGEAMGSLYHAAGLHLILSMPARGTATSEHLAIYGLDATEKCVIAAVGSAQEADSLIRSAKRKLFIDIPGNGVMLTVPLKSVAGGEKKKAEILQMLMLEPKLAILDETDSGLDVDAVRTVSAGIEAYRRKCGGSLLIITHSTKILESLMVDQTHIMVEGEIVKTGDASLVEEINRDGFGKYEKSLA